MVPMKVYSTFAKAWADIANDVITKGILFGDTYELKPYSFCVENTGESLDLVGRRADVVYFTKEVDLFWRGVNSLPDFADASKFWNKISDDGETVNSAYGYISQIKFGFNQIDTIVNLLKHDKFTRRAVININFANPNVETTKDEPCTICYHFIFREKLELHVYMRSNDIWYGLPYDVPLNLEILKEVSKRTGLPAGNYYHTTTSMHAYMKDVPEIVRGIERRRKWNESLELMNRKG